MVVVALLTPVFLLCLLLALGRYEERMLNPAGTAEAARARHRRRLLTVHEPARDTGPRAA